MRRILRGRRGFTLVEVIVASAILCLVIALTCGIILSSMRAFERNARLSQAGDLANSAYDFISDRLTYASKVELVSDDSGFPQSIAVQDGALCYRSDPDGDYEPVFADNVRNGMTFSISTSADGSVLSLTVTVSSGGKTLARRSGSFRMLNVEALAGGMVYGTTSDTVDPQIFFN